MDDRETELSRFRQQWQAEVTARTHPTTTATAASSSSSHPRPAPAPFAARRLSHHNPAPDPDPVSDADDDDDHEHQHEHEHKHTGLQRERSASPQATRRSALPSALEHYEKAVEKETQGSLGESLSLYRKAFRMDAKVDSQYREKYYPRPAASSSAAAAAAHPTTTTTTTTAAQRQPPASIAALIESFAHLAIPAAGTEDTAVYAPLSTLPHELLLHIMHTLAASDVASFARCAKVCKALAHVVVTEEAIWRDVCAAAFAKMAWDWRVSVDGTPLIHRVLGEGEGASSPPLALPPTATPAPEAEAEAEADEEEEELRPTPTDDAHLPAYAGSWRAMFQSRPRIRFNGVYISTCNYVRQGASQSGWNTPVHIVTYYRYLRFHDDGTVLSLLTSCEPAEVVHGFSRAGVQGGGATAGVLPSAVARYVARGRWRVDGGGRVDVETVQRGMERYLFRMQLRLGSVRSGGRWVGSRKLAWEGFWSWNRMTDDLAEFSLRNDKAFIFSRVGSIERELGLS